MLTQDMELQQEKATSSTSVPPQIPTISTEADQCVAPGDRAIVQATGQRGAITPSSSATTAKPDSKPVSDRKLEANRENGKKSSGPKSLRGKFFSRSNPVKHGMRAKQVLITRGPMAENANEFSALSRRVHRALIPFGEAEEMKVEEVIWCEWLYLRSLRCEKGCIDRSARIELNCDPVDLRTLKLMQGPKQENAPKQEFKPETDHLALPLGPGLDQIIRYRQAILRQRDRAILDLERLQRIRKGEKVAAPLKIQFSHDARL